VDFCVCGSGLINALNILNARYTNIDDDAIFIVFRVYSPVDTVDNETCNRLFPTLLSRSNKQREST